MSASTLYMLIAVADALIAIAALIKMASAWSRDLKLDAALWAAFGIAAVVLAIAYGLRAEAAS